MMIQMLYLLYVSIFHDVATLINDALAFPLEAQLQDNKEHRHNVVSLRRYRPP
ncbi:hypothetical protein LAZ46_19030 [Vibrio chemaguriensis]|nr:hypothetical protein [Vibrio chemaguriensis]